MMQTKNKKVSGKIGSRTTNNTTREATPNTGEDIAVATKKSTVPEVKSGAVKGTTAITVSDKATSKVPDGHQAAGESKPAKPPKPAAAIPESPKPDPIIESFVLTANRLYACEMDARLKMGAHTHEFIQICEGTGCGERTLARIAQSKNLHCSVEHIRKCLNFYRFMVRYESDMSRFGDLKQCHFYQLSRLLKAISDKKVQRETVLDMARRANDGGHTAASFAKMVSEHIAVLEATNPDAVAKNTAGNLRKGSSGLSFVGAVSCMRRVQKLLLVDDDAVRSTKTVDGLRTLSAETMLTLSMFVAAGGVGPVKSIIESIKTKADRLLGDSNSAETNGGEDRGRK
jgi:hypothetical protein